MSLTKEEKKEIAGILLTLADTYGQSICNKGRLHTLVRKIRLGW